MDQLQKLLKAARLEQGTSLEELAATLEIRTQTLRAFEEGGAIEADVLFGLVNLLNIPPELVLPHLDEIGWDIADEKQIEGLVGRSGK